MYINSIYIIVILYILILFIIIILYKYTILIHNNFFETFIICIFRKNFFLYIFNDVIIN